MSLVTSVHDVRMLILPFHPLLVLETAEEERVEAVLAEVAAQSGLARFAWSVTRGLVRAGETQPIAGTPDPVALLRHLEGLTVEAIYHLKDFGPFVSQPPVARKLREVAQRFTSTRSALVLSGTPIELPADLESLAVRYELALPDREELREVLRTVVASLRKSAQIEVASGPTTSTACSRPCPG